MSHDWPDGVPAPQSAPVVTSDPRRFAQLMRRLGFAEDAEDIDLDTTVVDARQHRADAMRARKDKP